MKNLLLFLSIFIANLVSAQAPNIQWQKCLGAFNSYDSLVGNFHFGDETARSIIKTQDGCYILAGETSGNDGDVFGNHGSVDFWVVKMDLNGNIIWQKCLGGLNDEYANDIIQTSDGGYLIVGGSESNDGDVFGNHGGVDFWVVKLNSSGTLQWQKCFGGNQKEVANSVKEVAQGGFVIVGTTETVDNGDVSGYNGGISDGWIIKISNSGTLQWQKCIGDSGKDEIEFVTINNVGDFVTSGTTSSYYGSGNHGAQDFWLVKINSNGVITWNKCYGGSNFDIANSIEYTSDNGYILVGSTNSDNGDVNGNNSVQTLINDMWVLKVDSLGGVLWQKCLGGTSYDIAYSVKETLNGDYVIGGETYSYDGDVLNVNHGSKDAWIISINASGNIIWERCLGGIDQDIAYDIIQTTDGGFIMAGSTNSDNFNGDVYGLHGGVGTINTDAWVVKLSSFNSLKEINSTQINCFPNPTSYEITITSEKFSNEAYTLCDQMGRVVGSGKLSGANTTISLSSLSKGIYLLKVEGDYEAAMVVKD